MNKLLFLLFIFSSAKVFSQNEKQIRGIIKVENASVEGIHVLNLVSEKAVITNANGEFSIDVNEDDFENAKGEAETLAGFILEISGNFPKKNQKIIS